jgi:hypothetical protein
MWYDTRKSELEAVFLCKDDQIKAAKAATKENPDLFNIEKVNSFVMHHTITVRDTFLEDRIDELSGVQMFPIVPYWPYEINGYKSGISEDLIGTQQEINWTHSMALNQVKQMSYPPVLINEDSTGDKAAELRTILQGGQRAVISKADYGGDVEFAKQPDMPTAEVFTVQAMNNVKTITGRLDIPESNQKSLSGKAKLVDVQKTQQGSMSIFSNYNHSLSILGNLLVAIIRHNDIFSEDEVRAIVDEDDLLNAEFMGEAVAQVMEDLQAQGVVIPDEPTPPDQALLAGADPAIQQRQVSVFEEEVIAFQKINQLISDIAKPIAEGMLIDSIHDMKIGKYNTKITMSPMSETMRTIKSAETFALNEALLAMGDPGLDGEDLIEATDVANKEKLIAGRNRKISSIQAANPSVSVSRSA